MATNKQMQEDKSQALSVAKNKAAMAGLLNLWGSSIELLGINDKKLKDNVQKLLSKTISSPLEKNQMPTNSDDLNKHLKGVKLVAEVARVLYEFVPKDTEEDVYDKMARDLQKPEGVE